MPFLVLHVRGMQALKKPPKTTKNKTHKPLKNLNSLQILLKGGIKEVASIGKESLLTQELSLALCRHFPVKML